jgi:hypothetical protein
MSEDDITIALNGIHSPLARLEGIEQETSNGLTRLIWTVDLWGGAITTLGGIISALIERPST